MGQWGLILLGVLIGSMITVVFKKESHTVIQKEEQVISEKVDCSEEGKHHFEEMEKKTMDTTVTSSKFNQKEKMKTPDELFIEQEQRKYDSLEQNDVEIEVDRDVMPINLEHSERLSRNAHYEVVIDREIVPEELEQEETSFSPNQSSEFIDHIPELIPYVDSIEEIKETMSYELQTLEEYGDDESIMSNDEIPN